MMPVLCLVVATGALVRLSRQQQSISNGLANGIMRGVLLWVYELLGLGMRSALSLVLKK